MVNSPQPTIWACQNAGKPSHQLRTKPADRMGEFTDKIAGSGALISRRSKGHLLMPSKRSRPATRLFTAVFTDFSAAFTEWRFPPRGNGRKDISPRPKRGAARSSDGEHQLCGGRQLGHR